MRDEGMPTTKEQGAGRRFLLVLAAYFALQVVLRVSSPAVLDLDESESVLSFQRLQPGYGSQPPLYAWLQWLLFSLCGVSLPALSIQKNLLLFGTYLAVFFAARAFAGMYGAMIAAASLVLLPQIGWESQRDLTHSVLATCMAALALWCYIRLLEQRSGLRYALLGLLLGLGLQSKYNFAVFACGLVAASLLVPEHRQALWNRQAWIALAVLLLSLAPHGLWLFEHLDLATRSTGAKMQGAEAIGAAHAASHAVHAARGLASMAGAVFLFLTPLWLVYAWLWWRRRDRARASLVRPEARFFLWYYAAAFACVAALVLGGALGSIKERWLQPVLFLSPLAFVAIFPMLARRAECRGVLWAAGVFAILILAGLAARAYVGTNTRAPFAELSAQLAQRFPRAGTLLASELTAAGNLYLHHPAWRVMLLPEVMRTRPALGGEVLLIDSGQRAGRTSAWPERFLRAYPSGVLRARGRIAVGRPQDRHGAMTVDYALVSLKED